MALVSKSIPNLINGISQQPPEIRLPSQAEVQENGLASVAKGLEKRPGSEVVQKLNFTPTGSYLIHSIRRDENESYTIILGKSGTTKFLKIFDSAGNEMPVQGSNNAQTPTFATLADSHLSYFSEVTDFATEVKATTVTDTTFFVSNNKVVTRAGADNKTSRQDSGSYLSSRGSDGLASSSYEALVYVKQGGFNSKYVIKIKVGNTFYKVAYQTPATQPVTNQEYIGTDTIAKVLKEGDGALDGTGWGSFDATDAAELKKTGFGGRKPAENLNEDGDADPDHWNGFDDVGGMPSGMTCTLNGSVLHFKHTSDFSITTTDSHGDTDIFAVKGAIGEGSVRSFSYLPAENVPKDFVTKVSGDDTEQEDDFYVKYEADDLGKGVWKECIGPSLDQHFDFETMPHRLVRLFDDSKITSTNPLGITFVFEAVTNTTDASRTVDSVSNTDYSRIGWNARLAGDDNGNPFPSFVGGTITDIFFHKNRIGFLNDENVIFSEAGNYYNFFPLTVITGLDSNPIDVTVSNDKVSLLKHAVPFSESLLFFSELQQFRLGDQGSLSPATVSIDVTTQFETDARAKPVSVGRYVFFAFQRGEFSGIREYFVDNRKEVNDAVEITSHVPQYIPGKITNLVSSSNESILVCQSSTEKQNLYIYKYYWQAQDKIQSSWSVWNFTDEILNCQFIGSTLQILISRPDGVYLENVNLSTDSSVAVMEDKTPVLLDRRVKIKSSTSVDTFSDLPYTGVKDLTITTAGTGYTAGDLNISGGGGTGFTGTFTVGGSGEIATVTITNKGSGYTSLPTIGFSTSTSGTVAVVTPTIELPSDIVYVNQNAQKIAQADVDTRIVAGDTIYAGVPFIFKYEFTRFLYKAEDTAVQTAKLQLRNINILYNNTGFFKLSVDVSPYNINVPDPDNVGSTKSITPRKSYNKTFSGFITNSSQIGEYKLLSGTFKSSILSNSYNCKVSLTNDEYLPCAFQSAEWEGFLHMRSRRI